MIKAIGRGLQQQFNHWTHRRIPPANPTELNHGNLFIFPSKAGFGYFLLVLICWLVATNYENNVVFAITCLLVSLFIITIHHSFLNLSGISLTLVRVAPVYAGEYLTIELLLNQKGGRIRDAVILFFEGSQKTMVNMQGNSSTSAKLTVMAPKRGRYKPGRIQIESTFPLGLLKVWSKVDLDISALVYPKPIFKPVQTLRPAVRGKQGDKPLLIEDGSEDFSGLRDYQLGDSLKRIAWKQYAREQGFFVKTFADYGDERIWLDWDQLHGLDRETRLSVLCGMLLDISATTHSYGLRLPGIELSPDRGELHKDKVLKELALFEQEAAEISASKIYTSKNHSADIKKTFKRTKKSANIKTRDSDSSKGWFR